MVTTTTRTIFFFRTTLLRQKELDSANKDSRILLVIELYDAKGIPVKNAILKFLKSLPSVWHVVATMIRGQPGLDELDFDDLYNNLEVYEHELKGASSSNSQSVAFMSTKIKGSTSRQSTANDNSESSTKDKQRFIKQFERNSQFLLRLHQAS
ncbi:hypothetical protein Tco_0831330 [Tanacetum coccineum]